MVPTRLWGACFQAEALASQGMTVVARIGNSKALLASPRRPPPPPAPPPPGRGRGTRHDAPASAACSPAARGGTRSGQAPPLLGGQISQGILHALHRGF